MNRYQLEIILERFERQRQKPTWGDALPWFGVLLAFLLALIPGDFKPFLGFAGAVWTAATLFGAIAMAVGGAWRLWLAFEHRADKPQSVQSAIEDIVAQMRQSQRTGSHLIF